MTKVGILLPREQMVPVAGRLALGQGLEVAVCKSIATEDSINEARQAVEAGAKLILARGYQAQLMKQAMAVPVIEIRLTAQEIGLLIRRAMRLSDKARPWIVMIIFKNMVPDLSHMEELFDVQFDAFYIEQAEEAAGILEYFSSRGEHPDVIIGGMIACEMARREGYKTIFYQSTDESIAEALLTAKQMGEALETEVRHKARMEAALDASFNGILRINHEGYVISANQYIETVLKKKKEELLGRHISELIPDIDMEQIHSVQNGDNDNLATSIRLQTEVWLVFLAPMTGENGGIDVIISLCRESNVQLQNGREGNDRLAGYTTAITFEDIQAHSPAMTKLIEEARLFALSDHPLILRFPHGEQQALLAKAIHNNSRHKGGAFVSLDLRGLDAEHQHRLLFGDEATDTIGALRRANHGTLYLKGLEHISLPVQHGLIRVLQPIGEVRTDAQPTELFDLRLILATQEDVLPMVEDGRLHPEFYYRMTGLTLIWPKLSACPEDLRYWFDQYLQEFAKRYHKRLHITEGGYQRLLGWEWEGNRLQLRGFVEYLVLTAKRRQVDEIRLQEVFDRLFPKLCKSDGELRYMVVQSAEGEKLKQLLQKYAGDRQAVAAEMGISLTTLWRRMKKYNIKKYS
ncbi:MAG: PrpR N-terminal domain-containing protein [Eubacteriales bacterium]|nr:PrpR N-terminal domain-containing protein [Eubacteriales bacterium]